MIPPWLQRQLEAKGRWNSDGISRGIHAGRCRTCTAPVVRGLDADVAGLPVTCDPQPVDSLGEAIALVGGRGTYTLALIAGRWQVSHRDQWRIAARRADHVLASHQCDSPPLPPGPPLPEPPATRATTGDPF